MKNFLNKPVVAQYENALIVDNLIGGFFLYFLVRHNGAKRKWGYVGTYTTLQAANSARKTVNIVIQEKEAQ
jgi:hypothetical protein